MDMIRKVGWGLCAVLAGVLTAEVAPAAASEAGFVHPGLLHGKADLQRMKESVAARREPIFAGYQRFAGHPDSQLTYRMQGPMAAVGRANNGAGGQGAYDHDATAAYHLALLWAITGDKAYARRSREIVNAWSATLQVVNGRDGVLMAGLGPFKMVNAAEILRHTDSGWTQPEAQQAERCFKEAIYPTIKDFALFANGNWDTAAIKTVIAIGVYCDDRAIFENGMRYYTQGAGDGALTNYILNGEGQCQESGRDAAHSQLGIGHLADCAEIAWNQGLDLYGYADNRLLKGFEYAARYHMGDGMVPFEPTIDRTGKYAHARIAPRGEGRPIYEQVYNHYVMRMDMPSPHLEAAIARVRPEGASQPIGDHPGFGTLLFARPRSGDQARPGERQVPAVPAALHARGTASAVALKWVGSNGATGYTVKRSVLPGGPSQVVARDVKAAAYTDRAVQAGEVYHYVVAAHNAHGESADSYARGISAALPLPWKQQDVGEVKIAGETLFDGEMYTLRGSGKELATSDEGARGAEGFHFAYMPAGDHATITARFVPQMSGMRSKFGLMMRETLSAESAHVSLIVAPTGANAESPGYSVLFVSRGPQGAPLAVVGQHDVPSPFVSEGRFMEPYWLRLTRFGGKFAAFVSIDGQRWIQVGTMPERPGNGSTGILTMAMNKEMLVGLPVCSGILQTVGGREIAVDTVIRMDHVSVNTPVSWGP